MSKVHVKTDDTVIIVSGDDKGSVGKVLSVSPSEGKVIVEGCNKVKKHVKPRKQGETGGIIEAEAAMYASKVQIYCAKCKQGVRIKHGTDKNGNKIRLCSKCGKEL